MNTAYSPNFQKTLKKWRETLVAKNDQHPDVSGPSVTKAITELSDAEFCELVIQTALNQGPLAVSPDVSRSRSDQESLQEAVFLMVASRAPNLTKDQRQRLFMASSFFAPAPDRASANPSVVFSDQDFYTRAAFTEIILENIEVVRLVTDTDARVAEKEVLALLHQIDMSLGKWMDAAERAPLNIMRAQAARGAAALVAHSGLTKNEVQTTITSMAQRASPCLPGVLKSINLPPKSLTQALKTQWQKSTPLAGVKTNATTTAGLISTTIALVFLLKTKERSEFLVWLKEKSPKEHEKIARSLKVKKIAQSKPIKKAALARSPQIQPQKMSF